MVRNAVKWQKKVYKIVSDKVRNPWEIQILQLLNVDF